jgi:4-hydroxybutyrate CoA-transferase
MATNGEMVHYRNDWRKYYEKRTVSAEAAVAKVKSGDLVATPLPEQPIFLMEALAARAPELKDVTVSMAAPAFNPGLISPEAEASFNIIVELFIGSVLRPVMDEKKITYLPDLFSARFKGIDDNRPESNDRQVDVFMTSISPPDENGYCSFGHTLWHKRSYVRRAKCVLAEINERAIRTYGSNFVHVSEIDYFVAQPYDPELSEAEWRTLFKIFHKKKPDEVRSKLSIRPFRSMRIMIGIAESIGYETAGEFLAPTLGLDEPTEVAINISKFLRQLVRDGDTIQVGVGRPSIHMVKLGVFDDRNDLGIHTEMGCPGMPMLVKKGVVNGKYKTRHRGKSVFSTLAGCEMEDLLLVADNPAFEQHDSEYVANIRTTADHDNMIGINNGLQIDFTGQICSESQFGARMINGQGGQTEMHIGAFLSRGGRAVTLLPSTALGGVSTIVPQLEQGSLVTIPRQFADTVVTEYGIARLLDKTHRERAEELISVAHPDHRDELRKEARKMFWPS